MPFTTETARDWGRKGGTIGGSRHTEAQEKARQQNVKGAGRKVTATCTCGQTPHVQPCPVYLREKQRESRARKKLRGA